MWQMITSCTKSFFSKDYFSLLTTWVLGLLLSSGTSFGQPCFPDGIHLTSQNAINNFATNYPDCTEIEGMLRISGMSITNFQGLSQITGLKSSFLIESTSATNLEGFHNLATVDSVSIALRNCPQLEDLSALGNSNGNWSMIDLRNLPVLKSLNGFEKIRRLSGTFSFMDNPALEDYRAVAQLEEVNGNFVFFNMPVKSLEIFSELKRIGGTLNVTYCYNLEDLRGLENITEVFSAQIRNNDSLKSLQGLDNLKSVERTFNLGRNDVLVDIGAVRNLETIGWDFVLEGNPEIKNLSAFESLQSCSVLIFTATALSDFQGLEKLTELRTLMVRDNPMLRNFKGLDNLERIESSLTVYWNHQLQNLEGLSSLNYVGNEFMFTENDALEHLDGLGILDSVGGVLNVSYNQKLSSLSGLNNLRFIGGGLTLTGNPVLQSFTGLGNVTNVDGQIVIFENENLETIQALENMDLSNIWNLILRLNPKLTFCKTENICRFIADSPELANVSENGVSCNDIEEISAACLASNLSASSLAGNTRIYPQPVANTLQVDMGNNDQTIPFVLYSLAGEQLRVDYLESGINSIDFSMLPTGTYFLQIGKEVGAIVHKVLKM
jgi:hypothetical protein